MGCVVSTPSQVHPQDRQQNAAAATVVEIRTAPAVLTPVRVSDSSPTAGQSAAGRRRSFSTRTLDRHEIRRDSDDAEASVFFWSDFQIDRADPPAKLRPVTHKKELIASDDNSSEGTKTFVFTDFEVFQKEAALDENIIKTFFKEKKFQWSDFSEDSDASANAFLWALDHDARLEEATDVAVYGDFAVPVFAEDVAAASRRDRLYKSRRTRGIRHYSIRTLLGHSARVKCIAIAPAETHFVSSSSKDDKIVLCDIASGAQRLEFSGHDDAIISAKFSNDGRYLATTSRDKTLMIWDTVVGKQLFILEHAKIVICCAFSNDGKLIVSGCQDRACRVWSTRKGKELASFAEHEGIITSVAFSPNNLHIVSASSDRTLMLWTALTAQRLATLREHGGIVLSCAFSADGRQVVSSDERLLHVWDVSDPATAKTALALNVDDIGPETGATKRRTWTVAAYGPAAFPDYLLAACSDRHVHVIDPKTGPTQLGTVQISFFTKAAVYCLSVGRTHTMFGDAFGNVYVLVLS